MAKVICLHYGRFLDRKTGVEFRPELVDGRYVGVALVEDPRVLDRFRGRDGFEIVGEAKPDASPKTKGVSRTTRTAKAAPSEE